MWTPPWNQAAVHIFGQSTEIKRPIRIKRRDNEWSSEWKMSAIENPDRDLTPITVPPVGAISRSRLLIASTARSYRSRAMNCATVSAIEIPTRRISNSAKDDTLMKLVRAHIFNLLILRLGDAVGWNIFAQNRSFSQSEKIDSKPRHYRFSRRFLLFAILCDKKIYNSGLHPVKRRKKGVTV